jgi:tetratricopeptide (TPR) repeat protein
MLLGAAQRKLREGRFARAIELLQRARALIDVLLSAEGGQLVAAAGAGQEKSGRGLDALVRLNDSTLRLLARVHLARGVAGGLREKRLRDDLAGWATTGRNVAELLETEYRRLSGLSGRWVGHAELGYRLGLLARATGRMAEAVKAFGRVLNVHPHHVASAAMLTVSRPTMELGVLRAAMSVHPETIKTFGSFAQTAAVDDGRRLEQFVGRNSRGTGGCQGAQVRANLAFALAELGMLDEQRAEWREEVPA